MANLPTGIINNISFGPARVYMKTWTGGSTDTPTVDVGFIGDDGVSLEIGSEKKNIMQGNPQLINYSFTQTQSVNIIFSSIQWDFNNFKKALGSGNVTPEGSSDITASCYIEFSFGGDPLNEFTAIMIEHQMAVATNTLWIYGWKCQSESGFTLPFGQDEHTFEYNFNTLRADTDWGGQNLGNNAYLIAMQRELQPNQKYDGSFV